LGEPDPEGVGTPVLRSTEITQDGRWTRPNEAETRILSDTERSSSLLQAGDLVVTKSSGSQEHIGKTALVTAAIAERGCSFGNFMQRLRPNATKLDSRYLHYFLMASVARSQINYLGTTSTGLMNLSAELIGNVTVPVIGVGRQRRVADFLDDQVGRIDNIIAARRRQIAMIKATAKSQMQDLFDGLSTRTRPLATLADARRPIQYGIVLPGPDFPGGVRIVKGGDVAAGRVRSGQLHRTDPEIESRYTRSRLRGGDLVISIRGSVGEVDVVPEALTGANLTQDAARVAPFGCDPVWLRWALELPSVQSDMRRRITGAMVPGINIEALRAVRIPDTPLARQGAVGKAAEALMQATQHHVEGLDRSNSLMGELKRSLVTAAVTGEFDVSSTDGSRVRV
jgi:type I restriction enzyme S subunit